MKQGTEEPKEKNQHNYNTYDVTMIKYYGEPIYNT